MADTTGPVDTHSIELTTDELQLVRAALRLLLSTLGREEAEELEEVRAILLRLPTPGAGAPAG